MLGPDDQPLVRRYYCSADGEALTNDDIVRGYENDDGSFTVVADEELDALAPRKSRDIDLRRFVEREEIPPQLLERPYVLAPAGESTKAYHLLAETMERRGRAGIATFVMRGKEYLAAIFAEGGMLRAVTMRFASELRTPDESACRATRRPSAEHAKRSSAPLAELTEPTSSTRGCSTTSTRRSCSSSPKRSTRPDATSSRSRSAARGRRASADIIDIMAVLRERMGGAARRPARARNPPAPRNARRRGACRSTTRSPTRARKSSTSRPRSWA